MNDDRKSMPRFRNHSIAFGVALSNSSSVSLHFRFEHLFMMFEIIWLYEPQSHFGKEKKFHLCIKYSHLACLVQIRLRGTHSLCGNGALRFDGCRLCTDSYYIFHYFYPNISTEKSMFSTAYQDNVTAELAFSLSGVFPNLFCTVGVLALVPKNNIGSGIHIAICSLEKSIFRASTRYSVEFAQIFLSFIAL